jgi:peptidoglycan/xylan/chitin deacetylase (PgdA/CDA1 family)
MDDGYKDLALIAPVFAEFDCPVTSFLTTGFLDGKVWMWWDRIAFIIRRTDRSHLDIAVGAAVTRYSVCSSPLKESAIQDLVARCKKLGEQEKLSLIENLAVTADVELPSHPPDDCSPLTWDDVRRCEQSGIEFAPHTVTHPILSRTSPDQCAFEIRESWSRLKAETARPVPIFCYPNGLCGDFGPREFRVLANLGFEGAVVGWNGYASATAFNATEDARFQVPRFGMPTEFVDLAQRVNGVERAKHILRRGLSGR